MGEFVNTVYAHSEQWEIVGYSNIGAVWEIVANSGIFPDIGNYVTRQYIGAWQQFFRTFQGKRQQGGKFIKCAEVRTKKVCRKYGMLQKVAQKKSGDVFRKIRESANKKRNYVTRYMREGNAQKCKQKGVSLHDMRRSEKP